MRSWRWFIVLAGVGGFLGISERPASAQICSINATPVAFGTYDVLGNTPLDSTGSLTYTCWLWPTVTVWLSAGVNSPSPATRQLASGANRLGYNLYLDAARTRVWGNPVPNQYGPRTHGLFTRTTVTIYGRIPAGQDVPAGVYSDTVTITLNY